MLLTCSKDRSVLIMGDRDADMQQVSELLRNEGFEVSSAPQIQTRGKTWGAILLALSSPRQERDMLRQLIQESGINVFVLSAGDLIDRIMALEMGASDCLSAPWDERELVARVTLMFKSQAAPSQNEWRLGDLTIYDTSKIIFLGEQRLELTAMEYHLLVTLMKTPGQVVKRELLSEHVFDRPFSPVDRSIDMHISRLRQKLGPHPDGSERIRTVRSEGYTYTAPLPEAATRLHTTETD